MHRFVLGHNNSTETTAEVLSSGDEADAGRPGGGGAATLPPQASTAWWSEGGKGEGCRPSKDTDAEDREKDRDTEYSDSEYRISRYDDDADSHSDKESDTRACAPLSGLLESGTGLAGRESGYRRVRRRLLRPLLRRQLETQASRQRRSADSSQVDMLERSAQGYDHSPEYRSDDEFEHRDRHDYRDHRRDRDRDRDRGDTDRDRRRRSPRPYRDDYYYREDVDYRDDPRRRRGDRRMHYDYRGEDYYSRENRLVLF
ncbi:hypothetical protein LSTR_LSTR016027 [Laodelphax striatellus]|uniref:Uncharacterized protein n=1 Tax=Laodelphax striatellus TaxID=195883 RepID=A0A482WUG7_LAOST|nr:hypothetical protein LSTR_LSTR016027 [Laodelphax striatellus]